MGVVWIWDNGVSSHCCALKWTLLNLCFEWEGLFPVCLQIRTQRLSSITGFKVKGYHKFPEYMRYQFVAADAHRWPNEITVSSHFIQVCKCIIAILHRLWALLGEPIPALWKGVKDGLPFEWFIAVVNTISNDYLDNIWEFWYYCHWLIVAFKLFWVMIRSKFHIN